MGKLVWEKSWWEGHFHIHFFKISLLVVKLSLMMAGYVFLLCRRFGC
jgi:hypothetical protein